MNKPYTPFQEKLGMWVIKPMTRLNIAVYRWSGGRLMGKFPGGAPVLLLTTTGRKSGLPRTVALLYLQEVKNYYIVGSKGGMSTHPAFVHNLEANPKAEIQVGKQKMSVTAMRLGDDEKSTIWPRLVAMYPEYAAYQTRTERNIRVYRLVL